MQKQKMILTTQAIYKYFCGLSEKIDNLITCKSDDTTLFTTDQDLYEALASIEDRSVIDINKLVKFLEVVHIDSFEKSNGLSRSILTPEKAQTIRNVAEKSDATWQR